MTCENYRALLADYVHHQLDAADDAAVYQHVQTCTLCRAELNAELQLNEALRAALGDDHEFPASIAAQVRLFMHARQAPSAWQQLRAALRPAIVAPAAAVILVAAILGYNASHRPAPTLSSEYFVREHIAQTIGSPSSDAAWSAYLLTSANASSGSDAAASPNG
mgnify:CR=1 FL=1